MAWTKEIADRRRAKRQANREYNARSSDAPREPRSAFELAQQQRAATMAKTREAERKTLLDRVTELEDALSFTQAAQSYKIHKVLPSTRPKSGKRTANPIFLLSDLHFGESVTREESLGTNEYDLKIAASRMRECWDNMLWLRDDWARTQTCDETIIVLNGDIVSGDIHEELSQTNDGGILDQCNAACDAIAPGIVEFVKRTPGKVHVICLGGNHGRLTKKTQIKNGVQHSAEHLGVYYPLRRQLGDMQGKLQWHIPNAQRYLIDILGERYSIQHGDNIRSQGGIGGTLVPMTRWTTRANDADRYCFGHFHEADAYGRIFKNGALIGESGYTKWLGVESRPPEQTGWCQDAKRGPRHWERISVTP